MKNNTNLTQETKYNVLKSLQVIALAAEMVLIERQIYIHGQKFSNSAINFAAKKIKDGAESIHQHLSASINNKDTEFFRYEYSLEIHRLLKLTCGLDISEIQAINNALEGQLEKEKTVWEEV